MQRGMLSASLRTGTSSETSGKSPGSECCRVRRRMMMLLTKDQQDDELEEDKAMNGVVSEVLNHERPYARGGKRALPATDAGASLSAGHGGASMPG